ncbi:MerR family transcriptional regulator [Nocardia sp. NPDC003693]
MLSNSGSAAGSGGYGSTAYSASTRVRIASLAMWFYLAMSGAAEYTIDELARAAGTTVRSVRVYHERGVLPPPEVRGRTGYYGSGHLDRIHTIGRLLDRGIKLNGIKELLAALDRGDDLGHVLGVSDPPAAARPESEISGGPDLIAATELQDRLSDVPDGLARVVAAGVFQPVDATHYRISDPELAALIEQLTAAGIPVAAVLREVERLRSDCDRVARRAVDLVREYAFEPYVESGRGPDDHALFAQRMAALGAMPGHAAAALVGRLVAQRLDQDVDIAAVTGTSGG